MKKDLDINGILESAQKILIVTTNNRNPINDSLAASIALALYIKEKHEKSVDLVFSGDLNKASKEILSFYYVSDKLNAKVLKLEIDYKDTPIQTIDQYNVVESFKYVYEVKPVNSGFDLSRVKAITEWVKYDLIITVGISALKDLGNVYLDNEEFFLNKNIINIDRTGSEDPAFAFDIQDNSDSLTKLMFNQFFEWKYIPNQSVSQVLLLGLNANTL